MGFNADDMYQIFKKYCHKIKYVDMINIIKLVLGLIFTRRICINGLNNGSQIEDLINKMSKEKGIYKMSDIKKYLVIPAVDLCKGNVVCFTSYPPKRVVADCIEYIYDIEIGKAVRASCSYPVIFSPCNYNKYKLIDGGIRENVPWKELKKLGASKVLSIVFDSDTEQNCQRNLIEVASRSINLLCRELSNYEMEGADYVLKIKSDKIGLLDIKKIDELHELGYQQTKKLIAKIKDQMYSK